MKPSVAFELNRDMMRQVLARHNRIANLRVFGSVLHGDDTEESDLDLLVDALPGATLFDLCGLEIELTDLLGVPVQVLTPLDLPSKFRDMVVAEAREV